MNEPYHNETAEEWVAVRDRETASFPFSRGTIRGKSLPVGLSTSVQNEDIFTQ